MKLMPDDGYTPTQRKLLNVLADGRPHKRDDLRLILDPAMAERGTLRVHICHIRKVLRTQGQDIICAWHQRCWCYQWVSLLPPQP